MKDRHGNAVSGASAEAVALYDQAVEGFALYRGDPVALLDAAIASAPGFAMAHLARAFMHALATEPEALAEAGRSAALLRDLPVNAREASQLAALELLLAGEWTAAAQALERHSIAHPHDFLALHCGHLTDFYRANARTLRDRIARALPHWSADMPGYSLLLGMRAFGLEECGDYGRAEAVGRQALDLEPADCWAHHAVAHVMEMQGRAEDGIGWMAAREAHWAGDDNLFKVHNWWHRALCHLELGQGDAALALYDDAVRKEPSAVALDLVDASALLWRLHLAGADTGRRWAELAAAWDAHADGRTYPFNDWHAAMAYLGAGREQDVARLGQALARRAAEGGETAGWAAAIALPLVEGFTAFWRGDHAAATDRLFPARGIANAFGGSHAQRDIIDWTLAEAALRGGDTALAGALAQERLALKPHSVVNRAFRSRLAEGRPRR